MKGSRRYHRKPNSSRSSFEYSRVKRSKDVNERTRRIASKLQILALRRPHALIIIEHVLDGMLSGKRREDRSAKNDD